MKTHPIIARYAFGFIAGSVLGLANIALAELPTNPAYASAADLAAADSGGNAGVIADPANPCCLYSGTTGLFSYSTCPIVDFRPDDTNPTDDSQQVPASAARVSAGGSSVNPLATASAVVDTPRDDIIVDPIIVDPIIDPVRCEDTFCPIRAEWLQDRLDACTGQISIAAQDLINKSAEVQNLANQLAAVQAANAQLQAQLSNFQNNMICKPKPTPRPCKGKKCNSVATNSAAVASRNR